ncbi:unnamed protein product [Prorocentrum cordatum]|uniref:Uncharacterized protein n=1 Tax=Prorocentrum cordatum TaxID=2364126 RepID=A0ABN9TS19_9DINO|nr:unnamed protein product [Polarella glacialis]
MASADDAPALQVVSSGGPVAVDLSGVGTVSELRRRVAALMECPALKLRLLVGCSMLEDTACLEALAPDALITAVVVPIYVNSKLESLVSTSLDILKANLSKSQLAMVKSALHDIHENRVSVSEAFHNFHKGGTFEDYKLMLKIEEAFYNIGHHIAIPSRRGSTNLLRQAYAEDVPNSTDFSFLSYQSDLHSYVNDRVESELDTGDSEAPEKKARLST